MDKPMSHLFILPFAVQNIEEIDTELQAFRARCESTRACDHERKSARAFANLRSALQSSNLPIFERGDRGFVFQDVADFIDALKDASLGEGIDWKSDSGAALDRKCLGRKIDRYRGAGLQQAVSHGVHNNRK